jgi:hypothetical protein
MNADDGNLREASETTSAAEPTGPPVDPEERPSIEPDDALPTGDDDEPSLTEKAKSLFSDGEPDENPGPSVTTSGSEPTPPPADPAERPRIEPSDALPTSDK